MMQCAHSRLPTGQKSSYRNRTVRGSGQTVRSKPQPGRSGSLKQCGNGCAWCGRRREIAEKYQGAKGRYKTVVAVWREAMEIVQQAADQARDDAALAQQAAEWARKVIAR